jgi:hypothetical protein
MHAIPGTTMYSRKSPGRCTPCRRALRQIEYWPRRHASHAPQPRIGSTATRVPLETPAGAEGVDASADSCPGVMPGAKPAEEVQVAAADAARLDGDAPHRVPVRASARAISISPRPRTQSTHLGGIAPGTSWECFCCPLNEPGEPTDEAGVLYELGLVLTIAICGWIAFDPLVSTGRRRSLTVGCMAARPDSGRGRSAAAVGERSGGALDCAARQLLGICALPLAFAAVGAEACGRVVASRAAGVRDRRAAAAAHLLMLFWDSAEWFVDYGVRPPRRGDLLREHGLTRGR